MNPCFRMAAIALTASVGLAFAEEATLVLRPGESTLRSFPAAISAYDAPACVTVRPMGPSVLRLTAGASAGDGTLSMVFQGGATERLRVEVLDDAALYVRALRERVQGFKGVSVRGKDGAVLGAVASRAEWEKLQAAIVEVAEYFGRTPANAARIRVTDEPARVRKELEGLGYVVRDRVGKDSPLNELAVEERNGRLVVSGKTYSPEALEGILAALRNVGHLAVGAEPKPGEIACQVDVAVDKYLPLTLRVAIAVITEDDVEQYGQVNELTLNSALNFEWARDSVTGSSRSRSREAGLVGNFGLSSKSFHVGENFGRALRTNSVSFTNHSGEPTKLHVGGTLMVNVGGNTEDSDDDGGLKPVEYGLTVEVEGGLISPNEVVCSLDVSQDDAPETLGDSAYVSGKQTSVSQKAKKMRLGQTYVLSNNKDVSVDWSEPSGVPILRKIPGLRWFFSKEEHSRRKATILLLVSPALEDETSVTIPTGDAAGDILDKVLEKTGDAE